MNSFNKKLLGVLAFLIVALIFCPRPGRVQKDTTQLSSLRPVLQVPAVQAPVVQNAKAVRAPAVKRAIASVAPAKKFSKRTAIQKRRIAAIATKRFKTRISKLSPKYPARNRRALAMGSQRR